VSGPTTPAQDLGPPTLRRGEMALSRLDPRAWMLSRATDVSYWKAICNYRSTPGVEGHG